MKPKPINWQRLAFARWLTAAEAAELVGFCEQVFIEKIAPALVPRQLPGIRKKIYDRIELDRFMERLPELSSKPHSTSEFTGA
jgi:hypothetical protein